MAVLTGPRLALIDPRKRGVSAVEAALLMPLVLIVLFALLEYGWMFLKANQIQAAARHGARVGAVEAASSADITAAVAQAMTDAGLGGSGYVLTIAPSEAASAPVGTIVSVTVSVPYTNIELMGMPFLPAPAELAGATSMAKEGPLP